jgi:hypothetical protein
VVTRVGVLTTRLLLSNSHTLSTCSAPVRFLKGPKTTKTGRRHEAAQKKPAGAMDGPAGVKKVAGTGTEQTWFHSGKQGVESNCDAECDAISADRVELLARAVMLVAGMKLAEAERAAVLARVVADLTSQRAAAGADPPWPTTCSRATS